MEVAPEGQTDISSIFVFSKADQFQAYSCPPQVNKIYCNLLKM